MKYLPFLITFFLGRLQAQTTLHSALNHVTDVIVYDVFTAPAASRIYAYSCIAAYEAMEPGYLNYTSFSGKLNEMPMMPVVENSNDIDFDFAGILACYYTAKQFVYSEDLLQQKIDSVINNYTKKSNTTSLLATINYAAAVKDSIIKWSLSDKYNDTRLLPRYTLLNDTYAWLPTGPDYDDAVEPYWGNLRTFIVDSAVLFPSTTPPTFSIDSTSAFFKQAMEVYTTTNNLTEEQKRIADFWDDNPYTVYYVGHLQLGKKKISPAGHWLKIASTALRETNAAEIKSAYVYALSAIAMADAFIACWHVKYNSNLLRPETYINRYIAPTWVPYITTPAFPEYSSGHSTISAACATILTYCIGDNLPFSDTVLSAYGIPPRRFSSFNAAANEASASRLYAGIHFRAAIENGAAHGEEIGLFILNKLNR